MSSPEKIGYTRVSTIDQDPELQVRILSSAGIPSDFIFVDRGISGTVPADKRPGFQRAMQCIEENKESVKFLYVYEISRLGRNTLETINTISKLENSGVLVYSMSPNEKFMQTQDKSIRQLLMMLLSWVAQRERDNLSERTKAGLDVARSEGKVLGRPRVDVDFDRVALMRIDGLTWEQISRVLDIPLGTIMRAKKRRGFA